MGGKSARWKKESAACCGTEAAAGINTGVLKPYTGGGHCWNELGLSAVSLIRNTIKYFLAGR